MHLEHSAVCNLTSPCGPCVSRKRALGALSTHGNKTLVCVSSGAPGRRDVARPEFIPMRADLASAMSRVLVV
eukprot:7213500-Prymnesium_polylepis.1